MKNIIFTRVRTVVEELGMIISNSSGDKKNQKLCSKYILTDKISTFC